MRIWHAFRLVRCRQGRGDALSYTPQWIPLHPTLDNFSEAINRPHFWDSVKNSLIIVSVVVVLSLVLAFLAALALAKFRFYGRKGVIVVILGVQMVPLAALIIPLYIMMSKAETTRGLHYVLGVDKLSGVIVMYLTFVLPFAVWTLRGFIDARLTDDRNGMTRRSRLGQLGRTRSHARPRPAQLRGIRLPLTSPSASARLW